LGRSVAAPANRFCAHCLVAFEARTRVRLVVCSHRLLIERHAVLHYLRVAHTHALALQLLGSLDAGLGPHVDSGVAKHA
jgi:hypothetical protein